MNKTKIKNWLVFALHFITYSYVIYCFIKGVPIFSLDYMPGSY